MSKTLVGMVTFGGLKYTKLAIEGTLKFDVDMCVVVGKPGDVETCDFLESRSIPYLVHIENKGFPASLNDIYDYFNFYSYDNLIIQGNDVIPYPYSISNLIKLSDEYDWVSAREVSVKALHSAYPEVRQYFSGDDFICNNLDAKPWSVFTAYSSNPVADKMGLADCQNLNLYTKKAIDTLGYVDTNFYGNGYFCDNDYVHRAIKLGVSSCTSVSSFYFHFWSRTIKEELKSNNYFDGNRQYYRSKWGGNPMEERFDLPYNGETFKQIPGIELPSVVAIKDRSFEPQIINYWRNKR